MGFFGLGKDEPRSDNSDFGLLSDAISALENPKGVLLTSTSSDLRAYALRHLRLIAKMGTIQERAREYKAMRSKSGCLQMLAKIVPGLPTKYARVR